MELNLIGDLQDADTFSEASLLHAAQLKPA
jgi:hypothetical protein